MEIQSLLESEFVYLSDHELAGICKDVDLHHWNVQQSVDAAKMWLKFFCTDTKRIAQGWKLHIAASTASACTVLQRVLPVLLNASASFKIASSLSILTALNQGTYGWNQIGKFITVYPGSEQQAVELALALDEATHGLHGPKVLSDRPLYAGSLIHYRYGACWSNLSIQTRNGHLEPALRTPWGELVADRRKHSYHVPAWCVDPFVAAGVARDLPHSSPLIGKRYLIGGIVAASPMHKIALAADLHIARTCILKAPGLAWEYSAEAGLVNQSLRHEAEILQRLAPVPQVPTLYDCIEQDGSVFLIMEDIVGETLFEYITGIRHKGLRISLQQMIDWAREVACILQAIHQLGLVYADLKPSNILVAPNGTLHLIDFELTYEQGSRGGSQGTRGYISPQRRSGQLLTPADDIYSFGALLYFIATAAEPSQAPRPDRLLERPLTWFYPEGVPLQEMIACCLHELPEKRYRSMAQIIATLATLEGLSWTAPHEAEDHAAMQHSYHELARNLLVTLSTAVHHGTERGDLFWKSTHILTRDKAARDVNTGNAGIILALAELVAAHPTASYRALLAASSQWLHKAPFISGQPLPGLYIGEAGVSAALLRAGQILQSAELIMAATERGRLVASLPYDSPDLFTGTAGRLRLHLLLWDETGQQEHRDHAIACGEHLLRTASSNDDLEVYWQIPAGYQRLSGQAFLGYAHGAAGIADALLDLFDVTNDARYLATIQGAARWLKRLGVPVADDEPMMNWPERANTPVIAPFWCHGGTGIGRFFLHIAQRDLLPDAGEIAAQAARSVATTTRWAGPTQCHGLAGNIEFLLDMYQATRQKYYYENAYALARCLRSFAYMQDGLLVFPADISTIYTPDYMVGYGGIALCLLRLSAPEHMPHQLSRSGFRQ